MKIPALQQVLRLPLLAAVLVCLSAPTTAASVTTTFQVTASVDAQCSVTANDLAFGVINPLGGNVDQSTTLVVKCTKGSNYTVGLSAGVTSGATIAQRLMGNGVDTMQYNLYRDAGRTSIWGNSSGSWASAAGAGMGTGQTLTIYGRVPSGQANLAVGSYAEPTITVTVTY